MDGPRLPGRYAASLLIYLLVCLLFFGASRKFRLSTLQNILTESVKLPTFCGNLEISVYETRLQTIRPQSHFLGCGWENADAPHKCLALTRTGLNSH